MLVQLHGNPAVCSCMATQLYTAAWQPSCAQQHGNLTACICDASIMSIVTAAWQPSCKQLHDNRAACMYHASSDVSLMRILAQLHGNPAVCLCDASIIDILVQLHGNPAAWQPSCLYV